ncbi:MAG: GTP-binding protein, partial [Actinobacteria bacterium]|nr:GTP-binding protein [Actinomycetota bacterium]
MTSTDAGEDAALAEAAEAAARAEFGDIDAELSDMERVAGSAQLPTLAIIGRPNVGKSTLVNRILGRREAVVEDVPGVTRDRVSYDAEWNGKHFLVMDTGGWDTRARGLGAQIAAQAKRALTEADAVAFVLDATVGATDADTELAAASLWSLGLGEPFPTSALHGRRAGDLLD